MLYAVASLVIIVFMVALVLFRIVPVAMQAVNTSRGVLKTLSDPQLNDTHREQILQQAPGWSHFFVALAMLSSIQGPFK